MKRPLILEPHAYCRRGHRRAPGPFRRLRTGARATGAAARALGVALVFVSAHASTLRADTRWDLEARLGGAWNVPLPLVIKQEGRPELRLTGRWRTEALTPPLYYGWRVARWRGDAGWAVDWTHHKLYLDNPPPEVQEFSISHGYNLATLQRLEARGDWRYGGEAGVVIAHPESEIRGEKFDEHQGLFGSGYYIAGPTAGVLVGRSRSVWGRLHAAAEARLTLSFAWVPVAGGTAQVPNLALHATIGLGWSVPE